MTTITGVTAAASLMPIAVVTGSETRPGTVGKVLWIGGTTRPTNMIDGDIWFKLSATGPQAPEFTTTVLNTITNAVAFTQTLGVTGTSPFTFAVSAGSLPAGLNLNTSSGVISGTPTASGSYSFTIQVTNAVGSVSQAFSGTVTTSAVAPDITTTALTTLTQGTAFSQTLAALGTNPISWTISAGTLPSGLTLNSANGAITGTPTGSGSYSFAVTATNSAGSDSQTLSGTISSTGAAPVITTSSLSSMQVSSAFSQTISRTGSTPITWGVSAGTIPPGLSINSSTGAITGTPTTAGTYSFTVQATNAFGSTTQAYTVTVAAATAVTYNTLGNSALTLTSYSDADVGAWVSTQFYQWAGDTALPSGSKILGGRLYVPAGSAHIGQFWYTSLIKSSSGFFHTANLPTVSQFNSNGTKKAGSALVAGWNQILFDVEQDVPPQGVGWLIGVQIGDGTKYFYDSSVLTGSAIRNPDGKNFFLAETGSAGLIARSFYNGTVTAARSYGIDVIMKVP
jgi:hypothetical protein